MCKTIFGILLHVFVKISDYLAITIDVSVITCDEVINEADSVSTNVSTDVTSTVSINFHN